MFTNYRKKFLLQIMSLTKARDTQFSHLGDYKIFRGYMKKEVYWGHMYTEATLIVCKLEVEGEEIPGDFDDFFNNVIKCHILEVYF